MTNNESKDQMMLDNIIPESGLGWLALVLASFILSVWLIEKLREWKVTKTIPELERSFEPYIKMLLKSAQNSQNLKAEEYGRGYKPGPLLWTANIPSNRELWDLSYNERRENNKRREIREIEELSLVKTDLEEHKLELERLEIFTRLSQIGTDNQKAAEATRQKMGW